MIFDFAPQIEIGAEILSRRGEDQRLSEERLPHGVGMRRIGPTTPTRRFLKGAGLGGR